MKVILSFDHVTAIHWDTSSVCVANDSIVVVFILVTVLTGNLDTKPVSTGF